MHLKRYPRVWNSPVCRTMTSSVLHTRLNIVARRTRSTYFEGRVSHMPGRRPLAGTLLSAGPSTVARPAGLYKEFCAAAHLEYRCASGARSIRAIEAAECPLIRLEGRMRLADFIVRNM